MARRQLPEGEEVFLDHVAHMVPDLDAAAEDLTRLGFTVTPRTPQMTRDADGRLVPAGTANRCVMLPEGYIEVLTPVSDTPLARQMQAQIDRYVGLHLICFSAADPESARARLAREGFQPLPTVALRRGIALPDGGEGTLAFSVQRVPPGTMVEGRVQYVTHHTPDLLWQPRWLDHANGATALREVVVVVADPDEAAERYARFTGRASKAEGAGRQVLPLDRGRVVLLSSAAWRAEFPGIEPPALPWIGATTLTVESLDGLAARCHDADPPAARRDGCLVVPLPAAVGGVMVFCEAAADGPS